MKIGIALVLTFLFMSYIMAQNTDMVISCRFTPCAAITHFRNDSLYMPDSLLQKYKEVYWQYDTTGKNPWYRGKIYNGLNIGWTEGYPNNGGFYIYLYRNYIISGVVHSDPSTNYIFYVQKISNVQYKSITSLLFTGRLKHVVITGHDTSSGKHYRYFSLNEKAMGLYTEEQFGKTYNDSTGLYDMPMSKMNQQYVSGLIEFIKAVNRYIEQDIPLPEKGSLGYDKGILNANKEMYPPADPYIGR